MTTNIIWIAAEVLLLLIGFLLLDNLLIGIIQSFLAKAPFLKKQQPQIQHVQKKLRRDLRLICLVLCLLAIAANSFLLYQGKDLPTYTLALIQRIPQDFWQKLAWGGSQTLGVSIGVVLLQIPLSKSITWFCEQAKRYEKISANDRSIEAFFNLLQNTVVTSLWCSVVIGAVHFFNLPALVSASLLILLKIYVIIALGRLAIQAIIAVINSLDALSLKYSHRDNWLRAYDRLRHLVPSLRRTSEFIIYVFVAMGVVDQISIIEQLADYGPKLVRVIGIIFLSRLLVELAIITIEEIMLKDSGTTDFRRQRQLTFIPLIQSVVRYSLYFSAGIAILYTLGINPTPILAGAGIVGLAVGLGAQNLINDMVCGFFILFENYYLVGDFVETDQAKGWVESIDLRTTRLRHPDGHVHIIRNGQMEPIINYSKQYVNAIVEVGVAYDSNLNQVYEVLETAGQILKQQCTDVLKPTSIDGLERFGESELLIRTSTRVKPGTHLTTQRLLRKLIKDALDDAGIEIPFAHRVLVFKPDQNPDAIPENLN